MSYPFPPVLEQLVQEELATGVYSSEDDVLLEADDKMTKSFEHLKQEFTGLRTGKASFWARANRSFASLSLASRVMIWSSVRPVSRARICAASRIHVLHWHGPRPNLAKRFSDCKSA